VSKRHGHLTGLVLFTGLVPTIVAGYLLWRSDLPASNRYLLIGTLVAIWLLLMLIVRTRTGYHLRTLSNLLAALREGDYSFRAREVSRSDPFSEVVTEINLLARALRQQRVEDLEATSLVRKVMAEIDVAVFAFDASNRLRQVNAAGEALFQGALDLVGRTAEELGLENCLVGLPARTVELEIGGTNGRWEMRRGSFREHGRPNHLLVLSDVSRALQAEELAAWKRLIRVIGHELNNSLAPLTSLAGSLERVVDQDPLPEDWRSDLGSGLQVIASRVEALNRFMGDCSRLAKLPDPTISRVNISTCIHNVAKLEKQLTVVVEDGPATIVDGDQDQLEQVMINLLKNAVEASMETNGEIRIRWEPEGGFVKVIISDEGPGLPDSANLFVPFYTTKPTGSGIGLFLSRQIAEAHGGSVNVRNRANTRGCEAILRVPEAKS
jgi:nitrogen fixation/metabolism regulation signal transduction histidine kinase